MAVYNKIIFSKCKAHERQINISTAMTAHIYHHQSLHIPASDLMILQLLSSLLILHQRRHGLNKPRRRRRRNLMMKHKPSSREDSYTSPFSIFHESCRRNTGFFEVQDDHIRLDGERYFISGFAEGVGGSLG